MENLSEISSLQYIYSIPRPLNPRNSTPRPLHHALCTVVPYPLPLTPYALRSNDRYLFIKDLIADVRAKRSFKKVHRMTKEKEKYQGHCVKNPPIQGEQFKLRHGYLHNTLPREYTIVITTRWTSHHPMFG